MKRKFWKPKECKDCKNKLEEKEELVFCKLHDQWIYYCRNCFSHNKKKLYGGSNTLKNYPIKY